MGRQTLGKGLDALLPGSAGNNDLDYGRMDKTYFLCPIDKIVPNQYQPRKEMDKEALNQLMESIKEKGVLQPLVVMERDDGEGYELIAGERRWRASKLAGLTEIPVLVKNVDPVERLELAIIENIQRQNLNPLEEAEAYQRLVQEFNMTQEEVAKSVGKERSTVANFLRILQLPDFAKKDVVNGKLSMGHARVLLGLPDLSAMQELRDAIIGKGLSVRRAEALARKTKDKNLITQKKNEDGIPESYCRALTTDLVRYLGAKSKIVQNGNRGKLEIEYYSMDDLERLLKLITKH
ncbi:MAG: ParB/RepB/Spo0J family partition protein [Proteobacteria bacterium]|nr:ParB/RepB/Spo0J family partition protein [Pseudomonadota bacterium]MBU1714163.1 ParB/RepB/Spo0J family partition protein [Pseudomonadota bacterium]